MRKGMLLAGMALLATLIWALLPAGALAGTPTSVLVCGTEIVGVGDGYWKGGATGIIEAATSSDYTLAYDSDTGTLTLKDATLIVPNAPTFRGTPIIDSLDGDLILSLVGRNTLTNANYHQLGLTAPFASQHGIAVGGSLRIEGGGTLSIICAGMTLAGEEKLSCSSAAMRGKSIVVAGSANVTVASAGIDIAGDMKDGSLSSQGVQVNNGLTVENGASLTVTSGSINYFGSAACARLESVGVSAPTEYISGSLSSTGGNISTTASAALKVSFGVSGEAIISNGGAVTAKTLATTGLHRGFVQAPSLDDYDAYWWRVTDTDVYRVAPANPFAWAAAQTYGEIRPLGRLRVTSPTANETLPKCVGSSATLYVTTTSGNVPSYQWQLNTGDGVWTDVSGATGGSYSTGTLKRANDGWVYRCTVSSGTEAIYSPTFTISMNAASVGIGGAPATPVAIGETVSLHAFPADIENPTYQWYSNTTKTTVGATPVSSATTAVLTLTSLSANTTYYFCRCNEEIDSKIVTVSFSMPEAALTDATVRGVVGREMEFQQVRIDLSYVGFKEMTTSLNVTSWFTNPPAGLLAKTAFAIAEGERTQTIYFEDVPTSASSEPIIMRIPAAYLTSGKHLTVTANPNARWAIVQPVPYQITKGANGSWRQGGAKGLAFTADGALDKLESVLVDGRPLTPNADYKAVYSAKSGSTVVTLRPAFLKTLGLGEHTLVLRFTDGDAETRFFIQKKQPHTGDRASPWLWAGLAGMALVGGAFALRGASRRRVR